MDLREAALHHAERAKSNDPHLNVVAEAQVAFVFAALALLEEVGEQE